MGMTHADSNQSAALKYQHVVHGKLSVLIEKASIMTMYMYIHLHIYTYTHYNIDYIT